MDIRAQITKLIDDSKISLRELSRKSGVRRPCISRFLAGGNIHIDNLEKILKILGHKIDVARLKEVEAKDYLKMHLTIPKKEIAKFCKHHGISYLAAFGSVVREDFNEKSDVDIMIELKRPATLFDLVEIQEELKKVLKTKHEVDVVTTKGVSPYLIDEINNTSEVIYGKAS